MLNPTTSEDELVQHIVDIIKKLDKDDFVAEITENPSYFYDETITRQQITMGASSYIKISEGCNCECGYCIIPKLRGKYKSSRRYIQAWDTSQTKAPRLPFSP